MKILILGIGKTKHDFLTEGVERYKKLVRPYSVIEEKYLKEETRDPVNAESTKLLKAIPKNYFRILLDVKGKVKTSEDLAELIKYHRNTSTQGIVFIIGGSEGVNKELKAKTDLRLSFSGFTLTHQMIRLFLAEQIYRAFTIINNKKYHK